MWRWLFDFRGEAGRARFLAGVALLLFVCFGLTVLVAVGAYFAHWPGKSWTGVWALILFVLLLWSLLALGAKRMRDIGWPPLATLAVLLLLGTAEVLWSPMRPPEPWGELVPRPVTTVLYILVGFVLLLWPGRATEERPRGGVLVPGLILATIAVGVGLGLVLDPLQGKACPLYGPGAPSDDCESHGVIGRYYSSYLVVEANNRLAKGETDRALKALKLAIAVRPQFVYAYNSLGSTYARMEDADRALAALDRALTLQPSYVNGRLNRAALLDYLGQRSRAVADLREVLRYEPDNVTAKDGIAYMTGGKD